MTWEFISSSEGCITCSEVLPEHILEKFANEIPIAPVKDDKFEKQI